MYKVRTTNPYIFMNSIKEGKNPQFENFSKNELIEMLNILSDEYRIQQYRINQTIAHLDIFIEDTNLSKYDTLKILMYAKKKLKGEKDETN